MLVELGLVEQRYQAVCEVLHGATDVDVARREGVARQTVHGWLRAHARSGLPGWPAARGRGGHGPARAFTWNSAALSRAP